MMVLERRGHSSRRHYDCVSWSNWQINASTVVLWWRINEDLRLVSVSIKQSDLLRKSVL